MYSALNPTEVTLGMLDRADSYAVGEYIAFSNVTQAGFNYQVPKENLNFLGFRNTTGQIISGPVSTSFSISKYWQMGNDIISEHTGRGDLVVYFGKTALYNRQNTTTGVRLASGAISDYTISAAAGEVPQISANFVFGDTNFYGHTGATSADQYEDIIYIPHTGIQLNLGGQAGTNAVISTTFTTKLNWVKEPRINSPSSGNRFMMEFVRPIEYTASVEIAMDDYMVDEFVFNNPKTFSLAFYASNSLRATYTMKNAQLIGESVNLNSQGIQTVTLQYKGVG